MPTIPEYIDRFRIIRPLGQGGMGALYLAEDPRLDRSLAIKVLKDDSDELRERFAREARTVARLRHVNIVSVFDVGEFNGQPYIAMEYIPGETLAEMVRRRAPIALARKLQMIEDLCTGLAYAHRAGVIHRDIKPANIMVDSEGTLKILDFGIARLGGSSMTHAGALMGTVNYMSPEQVSGQPIDARSDIFAVGAVFYELLSYRKAFPGSAMMEVLAHITHREPDPVNEILPDLDPEVVRVVNRSLEKDLARRYPDLAAMRRELSPVRQRVESSEPESLTVVIGHEQTLVLQRGPRDTAAEISALLASARAALETDDVDAARAAVEKAASLSASHAEADQLGEQVRVRAAELERDRWVEQAERAIEDEAWTTAEGLVQQIAQSRPDEPAVRRLSADIERRRGARERERARRAAVEAALERARRQLADGAFEAALRSTDEAMVLAPNHAETLELARRARAAIDEREADARRRIEEERQQAAEAARRAEEADHRAAAVAERHRAEEAERRRVEEAQRRADAEAERRRLAEETERRRLAEETERKRVEAEAERKRLTEEQRRRAEAEAERRRLAAAEQKRLADLVERRRAAEAARPAVDADAEMAATVVDTPGVQPAAGEALVSTFGSRGPWYAAVAFVIVVALGTFAYRMTRAPAVQPTQPTSQVPSPQQKPPPPIESEATKTPPVPPSDTPAGAALLPVVIDAVPWAQVTISAVASGIKVDPTDQTTPFIVNLPPGEYTVRLVNAEIPQPYTERIRVVAGRQNSFTIKMKAYDPEKVLTNILGAR